MKRDSLDDLKDLLLAAGCVVFLVLFFMLVVWISR